MKNNIISVLLGFAIATPFCAGAIISQYQPAETVIETCEPEQISIIQQEKATEPDHISTTQLDMQTQIMIEADDVLDHYNVSIPFSVKTDCIVAGKKYNICPEFLEAICWRESNCNPDAANGSCTGIMQVSKIWHKDRMQDVGADDLKNQSDCINTAADYLSDLFAEYDSPEIVLAIYNGDSKALEPGYISDYADDILTVSEALERKDGK